MIFAKPNTPVTAILESAPTGQAASITVQIERANGTTHTPAFNTGIVEIEPGIYSAPLTAPSTAGTYVVVWKLAGLSTGEELKVSYTIVGDVVGPDLITLEEAQAALAVPASSTAKIAALEQAIPWVSAVVRKVTDRDIGITPVTEEREYLYDGSGFLEVDDFVDLTGISINNAAVSTSLIAYGPDRGEVYYWIEGLPRARPYGSPEMGFTRNEDTLPTTLQRPAKAQVTATWGWPTVPYEIKQAVIWILAAYVENPSPFLSESIEGYSRTRALPAGADTAIPARAWDLLGLFARGAM